MPSGIGITVYATSDTIGQRVFAGVNASRFTVEEGVKIKTANGKMASIKITVK